MIKALVRSGFGKLRTLATSVEVRKRDNRVYDAVNDVMGDGYKVFEADVVFQDEYRKGTTVTSGSFNWEKGDEIFFNDRRLYVSDVVVRADSLVSLSLGVDNVRT